MVEVVRERSALQTSSCTMGTAWLPRVHDRSVWSLSREHSVDTAVQVEGATTAMMPPEAARAGLRAACWGAATVGDQSKLEIGA